MIPPISDETKRYDWLQECEEVVALYPVIMDFKSSGYGTTLYLAKFAGYVIQTRNSLTKHVHRPGIYHHGLRTEFTPGWRCLAGEIKPSERIRNEEEILRERIDMLQIETYETVSNPNCTDVLIMCEFVNTESTDEEILKAIERFDNHE